MEPRAQSAEGARGVADAEDSNAQRRAGSAARAARSELGRVDDERALHVRDDRRVQPHAQQAILCVKGRECTQYAAARARLQPHFGDLGRSRNHRADRAREAAREREDPERHGLALRYFGAAREERLCGKRGVGVGDAAQVGSVGGLQHGWVGGEGGGRARARAPAGRDETGAQACTWRDCIAQEAQRAQRASSLSGVTPPSKLAVAAAAHLDGIKCAHLDGLVGSLPQQCGREATKQAAHALGLEDEGEHTEERGRRPLRRELQPHLRGPGKGGPARRKASGLSCGCTARARLRRSRRTRKRSAHE